MLTCLLKSSVVAAAALPLLVACGGDAPGVSLAFAAKGAGGGAALSAASALTVSAGPSGLSVDDGSHQLLLTSAELVLRKIELEREDDSAECGEEDDGCEELEAGPILVSLPLDGGTSHELAVDVKAGTYDELELNLHKPEDEPRSFIDANPDFENISVRVRGTYDGNEFTFTSEVNAEQEIEFSPPLVVGEDGPVNATLAVDVAGWFAVSGQLVDPRSSSSRSPIEESIKNSFEAYEDDDHDGERDEDDD